MRHETSVIGRGSILRPGIFALAAAILFTAASARAWTGTADACLLPTVNAGGPYTAVAGGTIQLLGRATGTTPLTLLWTVGSGSLSDPSIIDPLFAAPGASSTV